MPATRINTIADIFKDAHFKAREMLVEARDDELGSVTVTGCVPKLSLTPGRVDASGGRVGRDTRSVLSELAHIAPPELEALEAERVVLCGE